ncbi:MAG TPA: ADP-glyceromanno-heptose 6-epimerase [Myxococcota bacterium]|nr:ADP-glyceromanno-heptose 6-epimerase [Myxococcota bacterium]
MIVVTGAAGFIGSNLVRALNARGRADLLCVDDLTNGRKFANLADCDFDDYVDKEAFFAKLAAGGFDGKVEAVLHQGACSDTTEWNGRVMLGDNYEASKSLFRFATKERIPFIYASSAAVYGMGPEFREDPACEKPLNLYGWSKLLFDRWVRHRARELRSQVVGLRYFNVYGPRESHKGEMASVAWKHHLQLRAGEVVKLFEGSDSFGPGEQRRDFVYVGDVVAVNLWFLEHPKVSGIYNVGTGRAQTFNDVARAVIAHHGRGRIEYVPFPEILRGSYQSFTEASLANLRECGCDTPFLSVEAGVARYLKEVVR